MDNIISFMELNTVARVDGATNMLIRESAPKTVVSLISKLEYFAHLVIVSKATIRHLEALLHGVNISYS